MKIWNLRQPGAIAGWYIITMLIGVTGPLLLDLVTGSMFQLFKSYLSLLKRCVMIVVIGFIGVFLLTVIQFLKVEDDSVDGTRAPGTGTFDDAFCLRHKLADVKVLSRWRQLSLTFNTARRFRYTASTEKLEERAQWRLYKLTTESAPVPPEDGHLSTAANYGMNFDADSLSSLVRRMELRVLQNFGGIKGICERLKVDPKTGLDAGKVEKRRIDYGANKYPEKPKGFLVFVWEAMKDWRLVILFVCALVSFGVWIVSESLKKGWYDGAGILFSIILVVLVTAFSDFQESLQFRDVLEEKKKVFIQVTRAGSGKKVSIFDLVVGDIVHLSNGDQIPADGLLIDGYELTVDESTLNERQESQPRHKSPERNPFLLSGTKVQDGSGLMLVTGVGTRTKWGHLVATLGVKCDSETPLQRKLSGLSTVIGTLGLAVASLTFFVLLGWFVYRKYTTGDITEWGGKDAIIIVNYFVTAVTITVVVSADGLPLTVPLTLAFAMKKMILDKALVCHMAACETMGSATTICSHKTGSLTTNKLTVEKVWVAGCTGTVNDVKRKVSPRVYRDILLESIFSNTSGSVDNNLCTHGTPTETALLEFGCALGGLRSSKFGKVAVSPFNSDRKKMGVAVRHPDGHLRAHWTGASEIVLGMCNRTIDAEGTVMKLTEEKLQHLRETIFLFGERGLTTLCLAYSDLSQSHCDEVPGDGFVCLAIVGIGNPVRQGVPEAVRRCSSAGIMVRMVTGDSIHTAKAIARQCGILTHDHQAVEGPDFSRWTEEQKDQRVPRLQVLARSSPDDKLNLVKHLRKLGEVVAVTCDGANEVDSLHEADVRLAMGIAGTKIRYRTFFRDDASDQAAKEGADVIVLDDNFATIVGVAKWGRAVYTNIQEHVQFHFTVILVALVINFTSACVTGEVPLTAVQLLWVKFIMESLGGLGLATDPPHDDLLEKEAIGRKRNFISNVMWRNITVQAIYQLAVLGLLQFRGREVLHLDGSETEVGVELNTMIFNAFVFCQVFNVINARVIEKLIVFAHTFDNWVLLVIIALTAVSQFILVSFLGELSNTVPLTGNQWLVTIGIGAGSLLAAVAGRFISVPAEKSHSDTPHLTDGYQPLPGEVPRGGEIV